MGQFNGGMNELMRQAARMQRKIEQIKKEMRRQGGLRRARSATR